MKKRICAALIAASAAFGLSGCVTDDGYGYGGVSLGYGGGYYAGDPYWGWYDDFYYPGTGYYIYDRGGGRHRWSDSQRRYWEGRRGSRAGRENWSGFHSGVSGADRQSWQQRRDAWRAQQGGSANSQSWAARREAWRAQNQSQGQSGATSGWRGRGGGDWSGGHRRRHGN